MLPAVEVLRRIWIQQFYRSPQPGVTVLRWRTSDEAPPSTLLMQSPYDMEARYGSKRDTTWIGYKVHMSETCDDDRPNLITHVVTTAATLPDSVMGPPIQQALADRDLVPHTHVLDSGDGDSDLLVQAHAQHGIDVVGPPFGSYSRQYKARQGYDVQAFVIDGERAQARCPQGHTSVKWTAGRNINDDPVMRIRFHKATCRVCPVCSACTWAKEAPRQLTVRPQAQHVALQTARHRQTTDAFKEQYALRAGIESCISQGTRRFDVRRSRYIGLARTQVQQVVTAVAMNAVRVIAWLWNDTLGEHRRAAGQFALLAPQPLARKALVC
jgi:transposase